MVRKAQAPAEALALLVEAATAKWAKQRKAEERDDSARPRRDDRMMYRVQTTSIKEAAYCVMRKAYLAASANGTLPANPRSPSRARARPLTPLVIPRNDGQGGVVVTLIPSLLTRAAPNAVEEIAQQLGGAQKIAGGYRAKCPCHDDRRASLSLTENDGKLLVYCHAGCTQTDVMGELKRLKLWRTTTEREERRERRSPAPKKDLGRSNKRAAGPRKLVAEYNYTDETGGLLYQAVRFDPKDFRQRRRDVNGEWVWSLGRTGRLHAP